MNLDDLRNEIDQIDLAMQALFKKRMTISKHIGIYKREHHLPIVNEKREMELLEKRRLSLNDEALWPYYESFLIEVMRLSKEIQ